MNGSRIKSIGFPLKLLLFFIGCDRGSGKDESLLAGEKILMENRASETQRQMTDFALTSVKDGCHLEKNQQSSDIDLSRQAPHGLSQQ